MKFGDLINYLDGEFPRDLSMPGDNDGVEVCVDYNLEIGRILAVVDITFDVIDYAVTHGYNCILSHHPMIYQPLKKLDGSSAAARKAVMLAQNNICAASFHTRLDSVKGGVTDCLIHALDLAGDDKSAERAESIEELFYEFENNRIPVPIGRIVTLTEEVNLHDFISDAKKSLRRFYKIELSCDTDFNLSLVNGGRNVKKIGLVGGSGIDFAKIAAKTGADTFFTGEGKYSAILDLYESCGMNIITAGHFETEAVVLPFIKEKITQKFPGAKVDCFIGEI